MEKVRDPKQLFLIL
jgi:hypothetical protein